MVLADRYRTRKIATLDRRHFEVLCRVGGGRFTGNTVIGSEYRLGFAGHIVRSAMRVTNWRGASRGALISSRLPAPVTTVLARRSRARSAACTTRSGAMRRSTWAFSLATAKNSVSVDPGHSAVTRTPVRRVLAYRASLNATWVTPLQITLSPTTNAAPRNHVSLSPAHPQSRYR